MFVQTHLQWVRHQTVASPSIQTGSKSPKVQPARDEWTQLVARKRLQQEGRSCDTRYNQTGRKRPSPGSNLNSSSSSERATRIEVNSEERAKSLNQPSDEQPKCRRVTRALARQQSSSSVDFLGLAEIERQHGGKLGGRGRVSVGESGMRATSASQSHSLLGAEFASERGSKLSLGSIPPCSSLSSSFETKNANSGAPSRATKIAPNLHPSSLEALLLSSTAGELCQSLLNKLSNYQTLGRQKNSGQQGNLVTLFCRSFLTYQLETWRQLVGGAFAFLFLGKPIVSLQSCNRRQLKSGLLNPESSHQNTLPSNRSHRNAELLPTNSVSSSGGESMYASGRVLASAEGARMFNSTHQNTCNHSKQLPEGASRSLLSRKQLSHQHHHRHQAVNSELDSQKSQESGHFELPQEWSLERSQAHAGQSAPPSLTNCHQCGCKMQQPYAATAAHRANVGGLVGGAYSKSSSLAGLRDYGPPMLGPPSRPTLSPAGSECAGCWPPEAGQCSFDEPASPSPSLSVRAEPYLVPTNLLKAHHRPTSLHGGRRGNTGELSLGGAEWLPGVPVGSTFQHERREARPPIMRPMERPSAMGSDSELYTLHCRNKRNNFLSTTTKQYHVHADLADSWDVRSRSNRLSNSTTPSEDVTKSEPIRSGSPGGGLKKSLSKSSNSSQLSSDRVSKYGNKLSLAGKFNGRFLVLA